VAAVKGYELPLLCDRLSADGFPQRAACIGEKELTIGRRHVFMPVHVSSLLGASTSAAARDFQGAVGSTKRGFHELPVSDDDDAIR